MKIDEAVFRWEQSERLQGVAFLPGESVRILAGECSDETAIVVGLVRLEPVAAYRVKAASGEELEVEEPSMVGTAAMADVAAFGVLQRWYAKQCDGDWEHTYGVRIDTLDNPGWLLKVDLEGTDLEHRAFTAIESLNSAEWISCRVTSGKFEGACGPGMLSRIVQVFVTWAENPGPPDITTC